MYRSSTMLPTDGNASDLSIQKIPSIVVYENDEVTVYYLHFSNRGKLKHINVNTSCKHISIYISWCSILCSYKFRFNCENKSALLHFLKKITMTHSNHVKGSNALIKLRSALKLNPISRIIPADPSDVNFCDFSALFT